MDKPKLKLRQDTGPAAEEIEAEAEAQKVSVYDILEQAHHPERLADKSRNYKKVKSRKKRDFWFSLVIINSILLIPVAVVPDNVMVLVASLAAVCLFTIGFSWIMWQVLSDY
jgi:cation transport ATPase